MSAARQRTSPSTETRQSFVRRILFRRSPCREFRQAEKERCMLDAVSELPRPGPQLPWRSHTAFVVSPFAFFPSTIMVLPSSDTV